MERVLDDLIWPAAAGNIVWSFFTIVLSGAFDRSLIARATAVAALGWYVTREWTYKSPIDQPKAYHYGDLFHLGAIVLFVLAAQDPETPADRLLKYLAIVFVVTIAGHVFGVWGRQQWGQRALVNALGFLPLALYYWEPTRAFFPWHLPAAIVFVLLAWIPWDYQEQGRRKTASAAQLTRVSSSNPTTFPQSTGRA